MTRRGQTIAAVSTVVVLGGPRGPDPDQPRLARGPRHVLRPGGLPRVVPRHRASVLARHPGLSDRRGRGPGPRARGRACVRTDRGAGAVPGPAARHRLYRRLSRHPDDPARLPGRLRDPGARTSSGLPTEPVVLGGIALTLSYGAYVAEVYRAGLQLGPSRPARRGARDRPHRAPGDPPRDPAPGGAPRRAAAAQRLHRAAEGRRADRDHRGRPARPSAWRRSRPRRTSTTRR